MSDRYLKDRRTGDLYGWNHEMAKLHYMQEVHRDEEGWDDGKPDPTYVDPTTVGSPVFPMAEQPANLAGSDLPGGSMSPAQLEADKLAAENEAIARAAEQGQKELNTDPPEFDEEGHAFLGYDANDEFVYETDEERDARVAGEVAPNGGEDPLPAEDQPPLEEPEPKPTTRGKRK